MTGFFSRFFPVIGLKETLIQNGNGISLDLSAWNTITLKQTNFQM